MTTPAWRIIVLGFLFLSQQFSSSAAEDHLISETWPPSPDYVRLLKKRLLLTPGNCARMLIMPSAEGESAISVYSKNSSDLGKGFYVTYTQAARNIWYEREYISKKPVPVKRIDAPIASTAALAVCTAWKEMLSRARPYDREPPLLIDPTIVQFSVDNGRSSAERGELPWKPGKHTESLFKLGKLLVTYCEAEARQRGKISRQIEDDAKRLVASVQDRR